MQMTESQRKSNKKKKQNLNFKAENNLEKYNRIIIIGLWMKKYENSGKSIFDTIRVFLLNENNCLTIIRSFGDEIEKSKNNTKIKMK